MKNGNNLKRERVLENDRLLLDILYGLLKEEWNG